MMKLDKAQDRYVPSLVTVQAKGCLADMELSNSSRIFVLSFNEERSEQYKKGI